MQTSTVVINIYADRFIRSDTFQTALDVQNVGHMEVKRDWAERMAWKAGYPSFYAFRQEYTCDTTDGWLQDALCDGALIRVGWGIRQHE